MELTHDSLDGGGAGSAKNTPIIILNSDGTKVEVLEKDINRLINKTFADLERADPLKDFLQEKGVSPGGFSPLCLKIPNTTEFVENFKADVKEHNKKVVGYLRSLYIEKSKKEYANLAQLAKEVGIKLEWDTNDWNKFALEVSRKEREKTLSALSPEEQKDALALK